MAQVMVHDAALIVRMPRALKDALTRVAAERGITRADLAREALATSVAVACGAMPGCGCPNCLSKRQVTP
jgi:hypothetical protein